MYITCALLCQKTISGQSSRFLLLPHRPSTQRCPDCDATSVDATFHACAGDILVFVSAMNPGGMSHLAVEWPATPTRSAHGTDIPGIGLGGLVPDRIAFPPFFLKVPEESPIFIAATNWNNQRARPIVVGFEEIVPTSWIRVDPARILFGDSAHLTWGTTCAGESVVAPTLPEGPLSSPLAGSTDISPAETTEYVLMATDTLGRAIPPRSATLEVIPCGKLGLQCCTGGRCESGSVCQGGSCQICGTAQQPCCNGSCNEGLSCEEFGGRGEICLRPCGNFEGTPCCSDGTCSSSFQCRQGICRRPQTCGGEGQQCCIGGYACNSGLICGLTLNCEQPSAPGPDDPFDFCRGFCEGPNLALCNRMFSVSKDVCVCLDAAAKGVGCNCSSSCPL